MASFLVRILVLIYRIVSVIPQLDKMVVAIFFFRLLSQLGRTWKRIQCVKDAGLARASKSLEYNGC